MTPEVRTRSKDLLFGIYKPNKMNPLTNEEIDSWNVRTPGGNLLVAEDIDRKTGVLLRYVARDFETPLRMGVEAAQQALGSRTDVDVVLVSSSYPTGVNLAEETVKSMGLGAKSFVEIGAACSGFARGLSHLYQNHHQFEGKRVLFIATEKYHPTLVDLRTGNVADDPSLAQTIFSDGSVAMVFEYGRSLRVLHAQDNILNDEKYDGAIKMPINRSLIRGPYIEEAVAASENGYFGQNGARVVDAVRTNIPGLITDGIEKAGLGAGVVRIYPHQGSRIILQALARALARSTEVDVVMKTEEGNWSSGSIMKALMEDVGSGEISGDAEVVVAAFGAGRGLFASTAVVRLAA